MAAVASAETKFTDGDARVRGTGRAIMILITMQTLTSAGGITGKAWAKYCG